MIDFAELKSRVSIEDVAALLDIPLKKHGEQLRGCCPIHNGSNDRQFVITPAKGVWYCFGDCSIGGDMIDLMAKVRRVSLRTAAAEIHQAFEPSAVKEAFQPLDYLQPEHESVPLDIKNARDLGVGYSPKGILRGTIAVPLRLPDGTLLGYLGVPCGTDLRLPKNLKRLS